MTVFANQWIGVKAAIHSTGNRIQGKTNHFHTLVWEAEGEGPQRPCYRPPGEFVGDAVGFTSIREAGASFYAAIMLSYMQMLIFMNISIGYIIRQENETSRNYTGQNEYLFRELSVKYNVYYMVENPEAMNRQ